MTEKSSTKTFGVLFVIIVVILLITHLFQTNKLNKKWETETKQLETEITTLEKQVADSKMNVKILEFKLELQAINMEVARINYGNANTLLTKFKEDLNNAGCKKMDQLVPYFETIENKFIKADKSVTDDLKMVEDIIFNSEK